MGTFLLITHHEKLWLGPRLGLLWLGLTLIALITLTLTLTIIALIALTLALTIIFRVNRVLGLPTTTQKHIAKYKTQQKQNVSLTYMIKHFFIKRETAKY